MQIIGLQKLTLIDYPGKIACIVFLARCNFRCHFCYNSDLVLPEKIKKQPKISEKKFFNFLKRKKKFLEGVVITGGEPCLNKKLPEFIKKIKEMGFYVKLDTNGSNPEMLKELIKKNLVDYIAMDIKTNLTNYKNVIGVKIKILKKIKKSIEIIKNMNKKIDYEFRTTVVPNIHTKEDILQITKEIAPAKKYYLQNFQAKKTINPKFQKIKPFSEEFLLDIQKTISKFFEICQIRN